MCKRWRILVVEDEEMARTLLHHMLEKAGYEVELAEDGVVALQKLETGVYDLVLLDVIMPKLDGYTVCDEVRQHSDIPIIMLTALSQPDDIVHGLGLGADDYITKPILFEELEGRIQSLLRRVAWSQASGVNGGVNSSMNGDVISGDGIMLNKMTNEVTVQNKPVRLSATEFALLRYLMLHAGKPISYQELLRNVWQYDPMESIAIVRSMARRLRMKIEPVQSARRYIVSVRGIGYKFQV